MTRTSFPFRTLVLACAAGAATAGALLWSAAQPGPRWPVGLAALGAVLLVAALLDLWRMQRAATAAAEEALRRGEARFRSILATTSEGYLEFDDRLRILAVNAALCRMLGRGESELIGASLDDIVGAVAAPRLTRHHGPSERRGGVEIEVVAPDGRHRHLQFNVTEAAEAQAGQPRFAFVTDVTRIVRIAEALWAAKAHSDKASRAKSDFLSNMSHELRTPLNAILGYAQLLELGPKEPLTPTQADYVRQILKGGEHLLDVVNEVLDLARIEAGRGGVSIEAVDVRDILDHCLALAAPLAEARGVRLHDLTGKESLPRIRADLVRGRQVLFNLVSNAIKYNRPEGEVRLSAAMAGDRLRLTVEDTGIGIPPERAGDLFKPFQRLGQEHGATEGTGIGLTITRDLMALMHGDVGFSSFPGVGSSFWVEFPLAGDEENAIAPISAVQPLSGAAPIEGAGRSVVCIEDNPANMRLMQAMIGEVGGWKVFDAATAAEGIAMARELHPDAVITDVNLSDGSGYDVLAALRGDPATRRMPVLALSADAMPVSVRRGLDAGFDAYLTKPINIMELLDRMNRCVEDNSGAQAATAAPE